MIENARADEVAKEIDAALVGRDPFAWVEMGVGLNDNLLAREILTWERFGPPGRRLLQEPEVAYQKTHRVRPVVDLPEDGFRIVDDA